MKTKRHNGLHPFSSQFQQLQSDRPQFRSSSKCYQRAKRQMNKVVMFSHYCQGDPAFYKFREQTILTLLLYLN